MSKHPVGKKVQKESRTALYAEIAARLEGVPKARYDEFFKSIGLAIRHNAAEKAASPHRAVSPWMGQRGRAGSPVPKRSAALRLWLLVEENALRIERALIRFQGDGSGRPDLLRALTSTPGVRQIIETGHKRDLIAIVLFSGLDEREDLRARLEELDQPFSWDDILFETHKPSIQTWRAFTLRMAAEENLTTPKSVAS